MAIDSFAIRAFLTIAETGSLSKAAVKLGSSHPTLSRTVAAMEDELGYHLFMREGAGKSLVLSERGQKLLTRAQLTVDTIDQFNVIASQLFDASIPEVLKLGVPDLISEDQTAALISRTFEQWPSIRIELSQPSIFEGYGLLLNKKIDGLLVLREDAMLRGININNVGKINLSMYAHPEHPVANAEGSVTYDFAPYHMFWPKTGASDASRLQWETWSLSTSYTQNFKQAAALAAKGLGAAPLPAYIAEPYIKQGSLKLIPYSTANQEVPQFIEWLTLETYPHQSLMDFIVIELQKILEQEE
ncbi:LysR family transcriptional regulator [Paraferrimonas sedimenticola]|uniref:HTH lysR-type domain-containing protein n=1 Tax=Paraferrimonas sedimenticola TaxID=375674 RepID=A0AA37W128_9GAMM|nr:LysR family transcriptional regulator [Paraferrimonas sedimenticola]GLP95802.1 hypothetical protein GCM10007895_11080 [Paraferrimonas sedimenticola]